MIKSILLIILVANILFAESISREAYFQRAFDSMGFILRVAKSDAKFIKSLSQDELSIIERIQPLVEKNTTYQWLTSRGFSHSKNHDGITFYYVDSKNRSREVYFPKQFGFKLKFSNNESDFDLKDGSPIRDAVTTEYLDDDILINRLRINLKSNIITLGEAFSLVFHEYGHKLGTDKQQSVLDSLASKIKNYVDQKIQTHSFNKSSVSVFKLLNAPFDTWAEAISYGIYQGVNIPSKFSEFTYHSNQGVWVFLENSDGIVDATQLIFDKLQPIINFNPDPRFQWSQLNWLLADDVRVQELKPQRYQIELNLNHLQFVVPFLKPDSPRPSDVNLYEDVIKMQSFSGHFTSFAIEVEHQNREVKLINRFSTPHRFQDPSLEVKLISKSWENNDLVIKFSIEGQHINPISENENTQLRPVLILNRDGHKIEIQSEPVSEGTIFTFILPNLKNSSVSQLKIESIEMKPLIPDLTKMAHDFRVKLFIPKIEPLEINGRVNSLMPQLVDQRLEGSKLKLIFHSSDYLRSIQVLQSYQLLQQTSSLIFPGRPEQKIVSGPVHTSNRQIWLNFTKQDMIQKIEFGKLVVEVDLDKNVKRLDQKTIPISFGPVLISQETQKREVGMDRKIDVIHVLTQDLRSVNVTQAVQSCQQVVR